MHLPRRTEDEPETVETGRRPRSSWLWVCGSVMRPERLERTNDQLSTLACHGSRRDRVQGAKGEGRSKAASVLVGMAK